METSDFEVRIPVHPGEKEDYNDINMLDTSSSDAGFSSDEETPSNGQISQEAKPSVTIVNEELEELEGKSKEGFHILAKLETILKKYPSSTGATEALRKQILETIDQGKSHPTITIGVVGATGAGKSSLINALLGEKRLVPTSGMRACTAAITEISYCHGPWNYEAEIQFVSRSAWEEEMRLLFEDMQDGLDELPSTYDSEFGIACAKFRAVYQLDPRNTPIEKIMEVPNVATVLGSTKYMSGNNATDFYNELKKYVDSEPRRLVSDQDIMDTNNTIPQNKSMQLWPLVELVRLHVKAPVLSTGVVLVDLPGLLDVNTARGTLAQKYIKNCSSLWVVAPITRAVDDHSARTLLGDGFKRQLQLDGGMGQLAFICSKTDDINLSEAADDPGLKHAREALDNFCDEKKQEAKVMSLKIQGLKQKDKRIRVKLEKLIDFAMQDDTEVAPEINPIQSPSNHGAMNISPSPSPSPRKREFMVSKKSLTEKQATVKAQLQSLETEVLSVRKEIKLKQREFERCCIEKRNNYSDTRIREDFVAGLLHPRNTSQDEEGTMAKEKLDVFCVSSKAFQILEGRLKEHKVMKGFITPEDTGIPQLQRYCLNLGVTARMTNHSNFLNNLGQLVNSLQLQTSGQDELSLRSNQDDQELLQAEFNKLKEIMPPLQLRMRLKGRHLGGTESRSMEEFHTPLTKLSAGDLANFVMERGITTADPLMAIIGLAWERTFRQIPHLFNKTSDSLRRDIAEFHRDVMKNVRTLNESDSRSKILNDQCLRYQERIKQIIHFVTDKMDSKQKELNRIFIPSITTALRPAYGEVSTIKGAGSFPKIKTIMANRVSQSKNDMFLGTVDIIKMELEELVNALVDIISLDVGRIFDDMGDDYLTGVKSSSEMMDKPLKEELLSFLNSTSLFGDIAREEELPGDNADPTDTVLDSKPAVVTAMNGSEVNHELEHMDN
ncbi:uncharacterized protein ARB_05674 [Trichophyton benhamiae CBS 112371]|uniref:Dynamin N-terminal domain-containing protein n=1 Tax=Arthroderma benhamiae (strain ATCC MYA-4681 / CBS 112371) TaxID=663331 RepID=D4AN69_ARTBC|nr:uncharacterized protein ARB_05674 [Trichophyton benhamiae CBS 112371]EFE35630.1 hypothetical protein ARB_05674 [Trichophyton benhamiae CBS 112371]